MKKRGISIIEILIAIVISAAVFAGAIPLIFKTVSANRSAKIKQAAYEGAQKEIENAKLQLFNNITNHNFTVTGVPNGSGTFLVTISPADLAKVTSRVNWTFQGKNEQIELNSYIYKQD